ncbi:MAG: DNA-formamidopyrimidine glycosylase family protein [Planctomycetota bacterium]|jgi:formamidopyrimidine-DNA glycosylase
MPELPEVERARAIAETVAAGRKIVKVSCRPDEIVYEGTRLQTVRKALRGGKVLRVHRRGKHIWFELDRRPCPCFHFGMTGGFRTPGDLPLKLASGGRPDTTWPPRFTKIHLVFDDAGELVMTNKRRLGRIRLRQDPPREPPISELGFDPLLDLPSPPAFRRLLAGRSAVIKALLLDQSFAAGVGNWIADEVLYQARIDPRRRASSLSGHEARRLRKALESVVETAVRVNADKRRFPKRWLFHHRWGKNAEAVTAKGERIRHITVGGRTTAWVPTVQR